MHANERDAPFHMGKTAGSDYGFSVCKCFIFKCQAGSYSHMMWRLCEFMCKKSNLAVWRRSGPAPVYRSDGTASTGGEEVTVSS